MSIDRKATSSETDDVGLDALLSRHLSGKLDGQLGRAAERFDAELTRGGGGIERDLHARQRRALWSWAASITAIAASIAIVVATVHFGPQRTTSRPGGGKVARGTPAAPEHNPTLVASTAPTNEPIERALWWRTVDQGTVYIDNTPMRQLLRQQVEELKYRGPDGTESVEVNVPRQEVMLVAYNKY